MVSQDWTAAISSEVFRNFVANELKKEAIAQEQVQEKEMGTIEAFEQFQASVNSSPKLRSIFKKLQHEFMTNSKIAEKTDPKFVQGVLLLNIEDE